jgi:TolB protein
VTPRRRLLASALGSAALAGLPAAARAALTIEIIGGSGREIPVTVLAFANQERQPEKVGEVVLADLLRSGLFRQQDIGWVGKPPAELEDVDWRAMRNRGADNLVIGNIIERSDGRLAVRCSTSRSRRSAPASATRSPRATCARPRTRSPT